MKALRTIVMLAICSALTGCACSQSRQAHGKSMKSPLKQLHITANVDGTGRMVFAPDRVTYDHFNWQRPTDVTINGKPWSNLYETPADWSEFSHGLKLTKARVISREGRDVITLELTREGFAVYLCDSPGGAAPYEITIGIPSK